MASFWISVEKRSFPYTLHSTPNLKKIPPALHRPDFVCRKPRHSANESCKKFFPTWRTR